MKELDRSKPYGTIHGDTEGRSFDQDGVYFDVDGKEWIDPKAQIKVESGGEAPPVIVPPPESKKAKPSATDEEIARQLKG